MLDPPVAAALTPSHRATAGAVVGVWFANLALETVPQRIIAQQQCSYKRDPAGTGSTLSPLSFRQDAASPTYVDPLLTLTPESRMSLKWAAHRPSSPRPRRHLCAHLNSGTPTTPSFQSGIHSRPSLWLCYIREKSGETIVGSWYWYIVQVAIDHIATLSSPRPAAIASSCSSRRVASQIDRRRLLADVRLPILLPS
jgi:hypothetical protein